MMMTLPITIHCYPLTTVLSTVLVMVFEITPFNNYFPYLIFYFICNLFEYLSTSNDY